MVWMLSLHPTIQPERILTIFLTSAPSSGPAEGGVEELAGFTCQADGSDVVVESDGAAELHQGSVIV